MVEEYGGRSQPGASGRIMLVFATGVCCVSALALAFSLGRHWPLGAPETTETSIPSLSEVRQRGAIPYSELAIDRGTESDKTTQASAADVQPRR